MRAKIQDDAVKRERERESSIGSPAAWWWRPGRQWRLELVHPRRACEPRRQCIPGLLHPLGLHGGVEVRAGGSEASLQVARVGVREDEPEGEIQRLGVLLPPGAHRLR